MSRAPLNTFFNNKQKINQSNYKNKFFGEEYDCLLYATQSVTRCPN